ncbi:UNVERIFIED_CONTAM: IS110 family transposase, partial [Streptococcus canis]
AYEDIDSLTSFLIEKSKNHFKDPKALSNEIQKAARSSYKLSKLVQESVNQTLYFQTLTIRTFEKQLKELDKVISKQVETLNAYQILKSIPGVGPV